MTPDMTPADVTISGYASLFDRQDLSGDRVRRGAFAASLLAAGDRPLPMLLSHETQTPVGVWDRVFEDAKGLYVEGRILAGEARANRTLHMVGERALSGLSIGYRAKRARPRAGGGRDLFELDLWEVSIVAFPMLRDARLTVSQS